MTASTTTTEVRRSRPYHALVGLGLASYGLVHLVLAWIALQLAFGKRAEASPEGALSQLGKQPLGGVLLWICCTGAIGSAALYTYRIASSAEMHLSASGCSRRQVCFSGDLRREEVGKADCPRAS